MWKQVQNVDKDKIWIKSMMWFDKYWGCHQLPERSFFIGKYQMPICARCLGVIIGYITSIILLIFNFHINIYISLLFIFITLLDWSLQFFNILISNNFRRLITGILGGIGIISIIYFIIIQITEIF